MRHWALQDAKARLSELVRAAEKEPQIITLHGEPKVEVRAIRRKKSKRPMTLLEALRACPKVPEFELPPRTWEPPRKLDL
jgi:prevent-host-death family protein